MSLRTLPRFEAFRLPDVCAFQPDEQAVDRWNGALTPKAAADGQSEANTISILDVIGEDWWTGGGFTSKRCAAALRSIGEGAIYVDLNSPGGDFFEGVAIYNMLREHKGKVTVRILGLAASAASVIAMAGDEIQIGKAGFMMVHNAWVVAVGNRHDLEAAAKTMEPFDAAMATVYAERAVVDRKAAAKWMDDETWFNGEDAVTKGLADSFLPADAAKEDKTKAKAFAQAKPVLKAEFGLAKAGMSRTERRSLLGDVMKASHEAPRPAVADEATLAGLDQLIETLRS